MVMDIVHRYKLALFVNRDSMLNLVYSKYLRHSEILPSDVLLLVMSLLNNCAPKTMCHLMDVLPITDE